MTEKEINEFADGLEYTNGIYGFKQGVKLQKQKQEEFAIGFALWKETIMQDENGFYYSESRAQISRKNPVNIQILLEIYKKETL
jgi:hypothetical protein